MADYKKDENEVGALWQKTGAKGTYFSGTINGERVVVFKNTSKKSDKAPDWRVLKAQTKSDRDAFADAGVAAAGSLKDDDIPF